MPELLDSGEQSMNGKLAIENGRLDMGCSEHSANCRSRDPGNDDGDMNQRGSVTFNTTVDLQKFAGHQQNGLTVIGEHDEFAKPTGCKLCRAKCQIFCVPCLARLHKPDRKTATRKQRLKYACLCPPHGSVAKWITLGMIAALIWAVLWSVLGNDVMPGGNVFGVVVLFIASTIGGYLVALVKMPPLLGMLLAGIIVGNVPHIDVGTDISRSWSSALRKMALVIILIRAGLGLDVQALLKLKFVIIRLAFLPCLVEATAIAVAGHYIMGIPWDFAFMLGFVIAAVSAAVAIPFMLQFQAEGYGVEKGVPTLVMACASIDNVLAITCFSIVLGIGFASGNLAFTIAKGPLQIIVAIVLGISAGVFLWYFPHKRSPNKAIYRFVILFGICMLGVFGSSVADWSSSGPLGVLVTALVAAYKWKKQGWKGKDNPLAAVFGHLWTIFQILLFGLVGALVDIGSLDWTTVALGVAVIVIGLCFRLLVAYLALLRSIFNVKERVFVVFSWLPKATVQAAIGSMVYDRAIAEHSTKADDSPEDYGATILMLAVVSIILTSPIGALLVAITGPRLLSRSTYDIEANISDDEDSGDDEANEENEESPEAEVDKFPDSGLDNPVFSVEEKSTTNSQQNCKETDTRSQAVKDETEEDTTRL